MLEILINKYKIYIRLSYRTVFITKLYDRAYIKRHLPKKWVHMPPLLLWKGWTTTKSCLWCFYRINGTNLFNFVQWPFAVVIWSQNHTYLFASFVLIKTALGFFQRTLAAICYYQASSVWKTSLNRSTRKTIPVFGNWERNTVRPKSNV